MLILAVDTALAACSAAMLRDGEVLATRTEPMSRGHAEALGPLVQEVVAASGVMMADLDRVAVTVGPGTFTGLRVGLAFARGIGLGLGIPVIGISTTEVAASMTTAPFAVGAHKAAGADIYIEVFKGGVRRLGPALMPLEDALTALRALGEAPVIAGTAGDELAARLPGARVLDATALDPVALARLAANRDPASAPPAPLYLRPPHITTARAA